MEQLNSEANALAITSSFETETHKKRLKRLKPEIPGIVDKLYSVAVEESNVEAERFVMIAELIWPPSWLTPERLSVIRDMVEEAHSWLCDGAVGLTLVEKGALVTCVSEDYWGVLSCQNLICNWELNQKGECLSHWIEFTHLHPMETELVRNQKPS